LYWQAKLNALDARIARGDAVHGRKTPLADAAAGEIVALPANPDPKAQRRLDKKARQVALKSAHREPADRVRQAEASNKPEVAALVAFIVDHFDGRLLPLTDDAWQAIGQWAGFRNLATAAQNLASDFGKLTADQRHATTIFNSVHDRRRERAAAHPAARPKKGEQKEPGPVPANGPGAKADQRRVAQATPVVVHLPEVKTQHPEPAKPQQQLKAMQPTLLGRPALGARDMKGAVVMEAHREWPRAVPRQVVAEGSGAKEELERLQAEYLAQQALLRSLADDMIVREDQLCELEDVKVWYVLNAAKVDQGAQSIHWKATHHPGFAKLEKPLQQLVEISARFEDGFVANRERDSEINRLKERLGWPT
jgi:hypothetical protein